MHTYILEYILTVVIIDMHTLRVDAIYREVSRPTIEWPTTVMCGERENDRHSVAICIRRDDDVCIVVFLDPPPPQLTMNLPKIIYGTAW